MCFSLQFTGIAQAVAVEMLTAGSVDDSLKEAWSAILKGDNAAVRAWVAGCVDWSHPIAASEYELHADGQAHLGTCTFCAIHLQPHHSKPPP